MSHSSRPGSATFGGRDWDQIVVLIENANEADPQTDHAKVACRVRQPFAPRKGKNSHIMAILAKQILLLIGGTQCGICPWLQFVKW